MKCSARDVLSPEFGRRTKVSSPSPRPGRGERPAGPRASVAIWAALPILALGCGEPVAEEGIALPDDAPARRDGGVVVETPDASSDAGDAGPPWRPDPKANPTLVALSDNTALDLGPYECKTRVPQIAEACSTIFDYSRLNYDPYGHRVLLFGGGHSATGRTDVDVLDLDTLAWQSLYPSMSCEDVEKNDVDRRGFHRATGMPISRHTYDQNVIATVDGVGRFMMLSNAAAKGFCHPGNPIEGISYLELTPGNTTWKHSDQFVFPWMYAGAAEFDPPSGMLIDVGDAKGASPGGMWVIDPKTFAVASFVRSVGYGKEIDGNLVYYPPTQKMYYFERGEPGQVWEVTLDRADWSKSTSTLLTTTGDSPKGTTGYAYDARTKLIGGGVQDGRFFTFDPATKAWSSQIMQILSDGGAGPGKLAAHHLDYDPINNVFIFVTLGGYHTWAYRLRG